MKYVVIQKLLLKSVELRSKGYKKKFFIFVKSIFIYRKECCNNILEISKPQFLNQKFPILLVVNNQVEDLEPKNIPVFLNLDREV